MVTFFTNLTEMLNMSYSASHLVTDFLQSPLVKKLENCTLFSKNMDKVQLLTFWDYPVFHAKKITAAT